MSRLVWALAIWILTAQTGTAYQSYQKLVGNISLDKDCYEKFPFESFKAKIIEESFLHNGRDMVASINADGSFEFHASRYKDYVVQLLHTDEAGAQRLIATTRYGTHYPDDLPNFTLACKDFVKARRLPGVIGD